jgi:hypothetical protein
MAIIKQSSKILVSCKLIALKLHPMSNDRKIRMTFWAESYEMSLIGLGILLLKSSDVLLNNTVRIEPLIR